MRQQLIPQLIRHEGLRLFPYTDTVGKVTIGVGRNLTDVGISESEAYLLLDNDLDEVLCDLEDFPWFTGLNSVRQLVVADMRFNLGPLGFRKFTRTLASIESGQYAKAATEMFQEREQCRD